MKNIENFITLKSTIDTLNIYLNRVIVVVFNIKTNSIEYILQERLLEYISFLMILSRK